jgi:hypothetical protein
MKRESLISAIIQEIISELEKKENIKSIEDSLLDPCINYIIKRLQPYFIATTVLVLTLSVVLVILITS